MYISTARGWLQNWTAGLGRGGGMHGVCAAMLSTKHFWTVPPPWPPPTPGPLPPPYAVGTASLAWMRDMRPVST